MKDSPVVKKLIPVEKAIIWSEDADCGRGRPRMPSGAKGSSLT